MPRAHPPPPRETQVLQLLGPHLTLTKVLLCGFDAAVIAVEGLKALIRYGERVWVWVGVHLAPVRATGAIGWSCTPPCTSLYLPVYLRGWM